MGSVAAGIATAQIIDWNPSLIILVGIMGGVKGDERHLGDLIVAEQIVGYEAGKITNAGAERDFKVFHSSHALVEATRHFPTEKWVSALTISRPVGSGGKFKSLMESVWRFFYPHPNRKDRQLAPNIHWGVVASGEKVIADDKTLSELQKHWPKLVGIEMEGYGVAHAIYTAESRPEFFMVKSICDWANLDKNDEWQAYAADVAAVFVVNLLRSKPL